MIKVNILILVVLFVYALFYSTDLHQSYSEDIVKLYGSPVWRIGLIIGLIWLFSMNQVIGLFGALLLFFYYADVGLFSTIVSKKTSLS